MSVLPNTWDATTGTHKPENDTDVTVNHTSGNTFALGSAKLKKKQMEIKYEERIKAEYLIKNKIKEMMRQKAIDELIKEGKLEPSFKDK